MTLLALLLAALMGTVPAPPPAAPDPVAVLHAWDDARAEAWATADPPALRRLYTSDSAAGAADVAMLRAWRERGLRVERLRMQVLSVVVRSQERHRLVLVVRDRVAAAVAVGDGVRRSLPHDEVSTRRLVLVRVAGEWRVRWVADRY
ncbi:hypothetical protein [Nocardioides sp. T2.26MG-1]|uniref:hypothetical protein n=1 Tax=Nocardioides sp. T2.26MG-1 TaxID=3041166 RepID=UPI0024776E0F|nr:hypothetical protein [Nocardioides sp. T2.26MG-1]CAI9419219.1 hypothetical protein HIDPHFAB_03582 [Nocardioides sp. T2.26MG-1]